MKADIGGQAVIEGVLMKSKRYLAISVRKNKKIVSKKEKLKKKPKFFKLFFIRGLFNLIEMLVIGVKALLWSAEQASGEKEKIKKSELVFTIIFSVVFAIGLFIILPFYLTKLVSESEGFLFNLIDGLIRVAIFLLYIVSISFMKDIKTIFKYHGAEHKAVNCYEAGKRLDVKNAQKFSTLHQRCGTAFIMIVLVVSIIVFSLIKGPWYYKIIGRVILIPVITGISYELLKLSSKFKNNIFFKAIINPGLWLQKITTKEPSNKQLEVALTAIKTVLKNENNQHPDQKD